MAKDRFSQQAIAYAKYRPTYPKDLFEYIFSFLNNKEAAWDCATGNGQAATVLAEHFKKVEATDISESQLKNAVQKENIHYSVCPAEQTSFADNSFDLITVATAFHWLDWKAFHTEATRVGRKDAVVAVWAYHIFYCKDESITAIINHFYFNVIHAYWDKERQYVDDRYTTVEFDFAPLPSKDFKLILYWNKEAFLGYLSSWSAVQNYIRQVESSPLSLLEEELYRTWPGDDTKEFHFPSFFI